MVMFLGGFVASGSDDGRWFIWEKKTGRLIKVLAGDDAGNFFLLIFMDIIVINFSSILSFAILLFFPFFCSCELCAVPSF